jgi:hypothetical protein
MAEVSQYNFSHQEVIETLIKKQGLHEGIWSLAFQLGMGATQIPSPTDSNMPLPAAVVSIMGVGLQRTDKEGPLALDAAKVNPSK